MSIKEGLNRYKGFLFGLMGGTILLLLSLFNIVDILKGVYLFIVSIPFWAWVQIHGLISLNDFLSAILVTLLMLCYLGLLGQLIFRMMSKSRAAIHLALFVLLIIFNLIAYQWSMDFLNSFDQAIGNLVRMIFGGCK